MHAPALSASYRVTGQRLFVLALLLLFVVVAAQYTYKIKDNLRRSAFLRWRDQILQLETVDIYRAYQYPNPPIMALMLRPLAKLEPLTGALLWFFLKVSMALLSLAAVFRLIETESQPFPPWAKAVAALLSLPPIIGDLSHGNVNILILFLTIGALYAWRRGYDLVAGLTLALAICCKVTPALFVPYFLWKRQWKLVAGCGVGLGLFLFEIPGAALGWHENLVRLESWTDQMVSPFVLHGVVTSEHPNQSLPGLVHRLLTHSPSFCDYPNDVYTPTEYHNVMNIGKGGARWLIRGAQTLFAVLVLLSCRAATKPRGGWQLATEFAIVLVGMLLFSERTWKHHSVTLMLPLAVLVYALAVLPLSKLARVVLIAALALSMALMLSAGSILSVRVADLAQVYGAYTWAYLLLLGALIACGFAVRKIQGDSRSLTQPDGVRR